MVDYIALILRSINIFYKGQSACLKESDWLILVLHCDMVPAN